MITSIFCTKCMKVSFLTLINDFWKDRYKLIANYTANTCPFSRNWKEFTNHSSNYHQTWLINHFNFFLHALAFSPICY